MWTTQCGLTVLWTWIQSRVCVLSFGLQPRAFEDCKDLQSKWSNVIFWVHIPLATQVCWKFVCVSYLSHFALVLSVLLRSPSKLPPGVPSPPFTSIQFEVIFRPSHPDSLNNCISWRLLLATLSFSKAFFRGSLSFWRLVYSYKLFSSHLLAMSLTGYHPGLPNAAPDFQNELTIPF